MPTFHVRKSTFIAAPIRQIYGAIRDFRQWPAWSPWLITEPETRLEYATDGRSYTWDGKVTGSGRMTVIREDAPHSIDFQLTFLKPWKTKSITRFTCAEKDGGTELTWTMEGSLPFFMFWAKTMMSAYVGSDYQRGLMLLKDYVETGSVRCHLAFPGPTAFPGCRYIGVRTYCPIADLPVNMQRDLAKLTTWLESTGTQPTGHPFDICHKWDHVKCTTEYIICFPIDSPPAVPPTGFVTGEIPACQTYTIRHTGPYRYLANAWATGIMRGRAKIYTTDKKIDCFEIYENHPALVPEDELVTTLHFPMK